MNKSGRASVLLWLVNDTFRQAKASGLFWLLLGISTLCTLVCFSIGTQNGVSLRGNAETVEFLSPLDPQADPTKVAPQGVTIVSGEVTVAFGAIRIQLGRDIYDAVRFMQLLLACGVADTLGILLALVFTAGFAPRFLDPATAAVLMAKPVPRWTLLLGKYLGVLTFVAFQALVFVAGTWWALGIRTGVWDPVYFLSIPLMLVHFSVFYSISVLLAVLTRSTVACVFGSVVFWLLCWGMNYGRHLLIAMSQQEGVSAFSLNIAEVCYWILPKPTDFGLLLYDTLRADSFFNKLAEFQVIQSSGAFSPTLSVLSSLLFAGLVLMLAAYELTNQDY